MVVQSPIVVRSINFDLKFSLRFLNLSDQRDQRPLIYDGRMCMPSSVKDEEWFWQKSDLVRNSTEPATMLSGSQMQVIEDCAEGALPASTDLDGTVRGAPKFAQIGADACEKVLEKLISGTAMTNNMGLILWDINVGWGNMLDAVVSKGQTWNWQWKYMGAGESGVQHEWLERTKTSKFIEMFLDKKLKVPGHEPMSKEVPTDLLFDPPNVPELTALGSKTSDSEGKVVKVLTVPDELTKTWYHHSRHGTTFKEFCDHFHETSSRLAIAMPTATSETKKRKSDGIEPLNENPAGVKRTKVENGRYVSVDALPSEGLLTSIKLTQKNQQGLELKIFTADKVYVVNTSDHEIELKTGNIIASFGKGKWKTKGDEGEPAVKGRCIDYVLKGADDFIYYDGMLQQLRPVVMQKKSLEPDAKLAYHDMQETAGAPGDFKVSVKNTIQFVATEENPKTVQSNAALFATDAVWKQDVCSVIWAVKWCAQGLSPIRPLVVLLQDIYLKPGTALQISPSV